MLIGMNIEGTEAKIRPNMRKQLYVIICRDDAAAVLWPVLSPR